MSVLAIFAKIPDVELKKGELDVFNRNNNWPVGLTISLESTVYYKKTKLELYINFEDSVENFIWTDEKKFQKEMTEEFEEHADGYLPQITVKFPYVNIPQKQKRYWYTDGEFRWTEKSEQIQFVIDDPFIVPQILEKKYQEHKTLVGKGRQQDKKREEHLAAVEKARKEAEAERRRIEKQAAELEAARRLEKEQRRLKKAKK